MQEFNIYIKLTNGCNLRCKHCFNEIMMNHNSMSDETLNKVIVWLKEFRATNPESIMNMSLHGGEPMLYNLDKILHLIKSTEDLDLKWCITTNLIYEITDKHLQVFKKMVPYKEPLVMTSYDFGDLRFTGKQENLWKSNVKLLQDNGIKVQPIICVTKYVVDNISVSDFFDFLDTNNIKQFNLERITETGRAVQNKVKPANEAQNRWLLSIFKEYERRGNLMCPLFHGVIESLKGTYLGCRARKCMNTVITINPDGSLAGCPNTADNTYGDLTSVNDCRKCQLIEQERKKPLECLICSYYKYCNGDCFQLKFDSTGCSGMKPIYEYLTSK